jgi:hypothetical protein
VFRVFSKLSEVPGRIYALSSVLRMKRKCECCKCL